MAVVVILLVAGVFLMALEIVLPGMVAGIMGLLCMIAAVALAYRDFGPEGGNVALVTASGILVVGFFLWLRFFPGSRLGRRFVSKGHVGDIGAERRDLLDRTGTAISNLRPSGAALIDGRRVDVVTEGPMVTRGAPVRVVAVEGMRVVVRATES